jgi:hypothetical protein
MTDLNFSIISLNNLFREKKKIIALKEYLQILFNVGNQYIILDLRISRDLGGLDVVVLDNIVSYSTRAFARLTLGSRLMSVLTVSSSAEYLSNSATRCEFSSVMFSKCLSSS